MAAIHIRNNRSEQRLAPYSTNHIKDIPKLRGFLTGIKPRLLLRNIPKDLTQVIIQQDFEGRVSGVKLSRTTTEP